VDSLREETEKLQEAYLNEFERYYEKRVKGEYLKRIFLCGERKTMKKVIKRIKKEMKGGGGGIGDIQHKH